MPSSSIVTQSLMLRYRRSVFSTSRVRQAELFLRRNVDHLAESRASGALRGFDVLELLNDVDALPLGVIRQELPLRRDRESLLLAPWMKHGRT